MPTSIPQEEHDSDDSLSGVNRRSWQLHVAYFDAAGPIIAAHSDESGKFRDPARFAELMQARALELAGSDPNSAVLAWIDGHKADESISTMEIVKGFLSNRDLDDFTGWTRERVLQDGKLTAAGLDSGQVDWEAITYGLLRFVLSLMP